MPLYWKDTIRIIRNIFDMQSKDIAPYFLSDGPALSKIENDKISKPSIEVDEIFKRVFDVYNTDSLAVKRNFSSEYILLLLQDSSIVANAMFQKVMNDVWSEDNYEIFIKTWLSRTRRNLCDNEPKARIEPELEPELELEPEPISKLICELYNRNFLGYDVKGFIDDDQLSLIKPYKIEDMISFIGSIKYNKSNRHILHMNKAVCWNIRLFSYILRRYLYFLKGISKTPNAFPEDYEPPEENSDFVTELNCYRQKLNELYQIIETDVNREKRDYLEYLGAEQGISSNNK